jgi:hypothetical protein
MVNGYSGFFPQSFLTTKAIMATFPSAESVHRLQQLNVSYCIVPRDAASRQAVESHAATARYLTRVYGDDTAMVDIYGLRPP